MRVWLESTSMSRAISRRMRRPVERLRASKRKEGRAGFHRPSSVNQEVAGSSPARGANYFTISAASLPADIDASSGISRPVYAVAVVRADDSLAPDSTGSRAPSYRAYLALAAAGFRRYA